MFPWRIHVSLVAALVCLIKQYALRCLCVTFSNFPSAAWRPARFCAETLCKGRYCLKSLLLLLFRTWYSRYRLSTFSYSIMCDDPGARPISLLAFGQDPEPLSSIVIRASAHTDHAYGAVVLAEIHGIGSVGGQILSAELLQ